MFKKVGIKALPSLLPPAEPGRTMMEKMESMGSWTLQVATPGKTCLHISKFQPYMYMTACIIMDLLLCTYPR